jgi:GNAT superfamily N-acetyltransferase
MNMEFMELQTEQDREESFPVFKELVPQLVKEEFLQAFQHEILSPHKVFGLRVSGELVSVAAVWVLMTGLLDKILWIYAFVTKQGMRSRGFGKELFLGFEDYAKREEFTEIRVHTHREEALEFWKKKIGFETFSTVLRKPIGGN